MATRQGASDLDRVRRDLSTLREAAGIGLPFGIEVVRFWLIIAGAAALVAVALAFGTATHKLATLFLFAVVGAALLASVIVYLVRVTGRRATEPAPFREMRQITLMKIAVLPFVIAYFVWQGWLGVPAAQIASTAAFFTGVITMLYAISAWPRRLAAGLAVPIMIYGGLIPVLSADQRMVFAALAVTCAGLLSASILSWQLGRTR
jgi:hypothetical protein